jgi:phosphoenolpyruvate-protein kinase (PTS system EI component)
VLQIADGTTLALDGSTGLVILDPDAEASALAAQRMQARRLAREQERAQSGTPALTTDGKRITVLANVATAAELAVALGAGAEGIGLLRTELAFLDAPCWPDEQSYTSALAPILDGLEGRPALVRVLDFGADKSPPFLRGTDARGLALLLSHPEEFIRQLRAILHCGAGRDVRIFLPMVDQPEQVEEARALLRRAARELGVERIPALGSMVETPLSAANADAIAGVSDFLSIGTNDLTATTLGLDRFATGEARAHDPHVLRLIAKTVQAARRAGIPIEVCGESASDPVMLPLLIGLGVDQISVGAAQVGPVRRWIRCIRAEIAVTLAQSTLVMDSAEEVERAVGPLASELTAPEPRTLADEPTQVGV